MGATATITYKVLIGDSVPSPSPIPNSVVANYTYTVDPNGASATNNSNTVTTEVNSAIVSTVKEVDKAYAVPAGTMFVPGSLVGATGAPPTLTLTAPIVPSGSSIISYQVLVGNSVPNPNPVDNTATIAYAYTVDPRQTDGVTASATSNAAITVVFCYNYSQEITDLVDSVALEQATLAAVINAEGAKIQKMAAMQNITSQELLCLNKSVSDMMDSLSTLEAVLKQKLGVADCQINGLCQ